MQCEAKQTTIWIQIKNKKKQYFFKTVNIHYSLEPWEDKQSRMQRHIHKRVGEWARLFPSFVLNSDTRFL